MDSQLSTRSFRSIRRLDPVWSILLLLENDFKSIQIFKTETQIDKDVCRHNPERITAASPLRKLSSKFFNKIGGGGPTPKKSAKKEKEEKSFKSCSLQQKTLKMIEF